MTKHLCCPRCGSTLVNPDAASAEKFQQENFRLRTRNNELLSALHASDQENHLLREELSNCTQEAR